MDTQQLRHDTLVERDDDARLVLGDALMERGDPLGSFVGVQCQLARTPPGLAAVTLRAQERALLDAHGKDWLAGLPAGRYHFARGRVERVECRVAVWLAEHARINAALAPSALKLHGTMTDGAALAAGPQLAGLDDLHCDFQIQALDAEALLAGTALANLRRLRFHYPFLEESGVLALARNRHAAGLRELHVEGTGSSLTADGLVALYSSPHLAGCDLRIVRSRITDEIAGPLVDSGVLAGRALVEMNGWAVSERTVAALCAAPHLVGVRALRLPGQAIGDAGAVALAACPHVGGLAELDLLGLGEEYGDASRYVGDQGFHALYRSDRFAGLSAVTLGGSHRASDATASALWDAPWLPQLTGLRLFLKLPTPELTAAVRAGAFDRLERLRLDYTDDEQVAVLLDAPLPRLTSLEMMGFSVRLSPATKEALAARWGTVVELQFPHQRWTPSVKVE